MAEPFAIGPRQTVDHVLHPHRGYGRAVYDNGPSCFVPDTGGDPVAMRIGGGGASAGPPPRSWRVLHDPVHGRVEADVRDAGERHRRMWSPLLGLGWLVWERAGGLRFEGDDARVARWTWSRVAVGTPDYVARDAKRRRKCEPITDEEGRWQTFTMRDGSVLAFRRGGPPPPPQPTPPPAQGGLFDGERDR